jgi:cytoskeletal protein CcmA (bactofilin family)
MFKKKDNKKRRLGEKAESTESIIAPGTKFKGTIRGHDSVRIFGHFEGKINCEQLVWVEKEGKIEGTVNSPSVIIEGEVKGDIESAEHVELKAEGRVIGNINTDLIAIADGGSFNGEIQMPRKKDKSISVVEKWIGGSQVDNQDKSLPSKATNISDVKSDGPSEKMLTQRKISS